MSGPSTGNIFLTGNTACLECGAPMTALQSRTSKVCGRPLCVRRFDAVPARLRCTVCSRPLRLEDVAMATCARNSCRRQRLIDRQAESQRQQREVLEAEARALRERAGLDHKIEDAESFRLTVIPRNDGRSRKLPAKRRRALRAHLIRVLHEAMSHEEALRTGAEVPRAMFSPLEVPSEDLGRVLQIACTACRGQCCRAGDEHAYITADTLLTYRRAHPGLAFDAIVDAYMAHVPGNTLQPGCVYQHAHGCMLPRDMRGDTCNRHFCQELKELKRSVGTQDVPKLFFVPTRDQNFSRAVFVAPMLVKIARRVSDPAS